MGSNFKYGPALSNHHYEWLKIALSTDLFHCGANHSKYDPPIQHSTYEAWGIRSNK